MTSPLKPACLLLTAALFMTGCSEPAPPAEIDLSQVPAEVSSAFAGAEGEAKQAADLAAQSLSSGDYVASLGQVQELRDRDNLTPEQREALAQSEMAIMKKLQEDAAAGDARAAAAMEMHRARK